MEGKPHRPSSFKDHGVAAAQEGAARLYEFAEILEDPEKMKELLEMPKWILAGALRAHAQHLDLLAYELWYNNESDPLATYPERKED